MIASKILLALLYNTFIVFACFEGSLNDIWYAVFAGLILCPNIWAAWTAAMFWTHEDQSRREQMVEACIAVIITTISLAILNNLYLDLYYLPLNDLDQIDRGLFKQSKRTQMISDLFTALWIGFLPQNPKTPLKSIYWLKKYK